MDAKNSHSHAFLYPFIDNGGDEATALHTMTEISKTKSAFMKLKFFCVHTVLAVHRPCSLHFFSCFQEHRMLYEMDNCVVLAN